MGDLFRFVICLCLAIICFGAYKYSRAKNVSFTKALGKEAKTFFSDVNEGWNSK